MESTLTLAPVSNDIDPFNFQPSADPANSIMDAGSLASAGRQAYRNDYHAWFADARGKLDGVRLDPEPFFKDTDLSFDADPKRARILALNSAAMDLYGDGSTEIPTDDTALPRKILLQETAARVYGVKEPITEDGFHDLETKAAQGRTDTRARMDAVAAAAIQKATLEMVKPGTVVAGWKSALDQARAMPGYQKGRDMDLKERYEAVGNEVKHRLGAYAPQIKTMMETMAAQDGAGAITAVLKQPTVLGAVAEIAAAKPQVRQSAFEIYQSLKPEERDGFVEAIGIIVQSLPKEQQPEYYANIAKSGGRELEHSLQRGITTVQGLGLDQPTDAGVGLADAFWGTDNYAKSEASRLQEREEWRKRSDFVQKIIDLQEGVYDPVKKILDGGWGVAEQMVYDLPGVLLSSAEAVYAPPLLAVDLLELHYQSGLRRQMDQGVPYEKASATATMLAPGAMALEYVSERLRAKLLFGKLPFFNKALTRSMDQLENGLVRGGLRLGAAGMEQTGQEIAANYIDAVMQDLGHAMGMDVGNVTWLGENNEFKGDWAENLQTAMAVLPLTFFGLRGLAGRDARVKAFRDASDTEILAAGYSRESLANIRGGISKGLNSGELAIDAAYETVDPQSEEAAAAVAELQRQAAAQQAASHDLAALGYESPRIVSRADGTFAVHDSRTGEEVGTAADLSGARRLIRAHTAALDDASSDQMMALATLLSGTQTASKLMGVETEVDLGKLFNRETVETMGPEFVETYAQEMALQEQAAGGTGAITRNVIGLTISEQRGGVATLVTKIFQGGTLPTVFHEDFHVLRERARAAGTITRADDIDLLRDLDTIFAGRTTNMRRGDGAGTQARFIPEGMTDEQIPDKLLSEAIGEIGEMEIFKTAKRGPSRFNVPRSVISRHIGAVARLEPGAARNFKAFCAAAKARWGLAQSRAYLMKKAEKAGHFDSSTYQAYLDKLMGLDRQKAHEARVKAELAKLLENAGPMFSLGPVELPSTTQESRGIADPALIGADFTADSGTSPVSSAKALALAFQSAPGEPGDLSPRGDSGKVSFSLGRARENYEKAENKVSEARTALAEAQHANEADRAHWENQHGREIQTTGFITTAYKKNAAGEWESDSRESYSRWIATEPDFVENSLKNGFTHFVTHDFGTIRGTGKATRIIRDGAIIAESTGFDHAPFLENKELQAARESLADAEAALYLASEEFDPVNAPDPNDTSADPPPQAATTAAARTLNPHQAAFAALLDARDEEAKNAAKSFVAHVWNTYGAHDEIFQYGKTTSKDAEEIAKAVSLPGKMVTVRESGSTLRFMGQEGHLDVRDIDTARPDIRSSAAGSQGKLSGGGSQLYQAALDWIRNNGKRIKDDTSGITAINCIRRTSNMAASAIRWGTTRHLKPHAEQKVGKWTNNDILNTSLLLTKEMENVFKAIPEAKSWTFDFSRGIFRKADGNELTDDDANEASVAASPGTSGIGVSTLQRGIVTASAIQEFQRGAVANTLESAKSELPGSLTGVSYSLGPANMASIMAGDALSRIKDPRRLAQVMSRIARDFDELRVRNERQLLLSTHKQGKGELKRAANLEEERLRDEYVGAAYARRQGVMDDADLTKIKSQPGHALLANPDTPLRGRVMSKRQAIDKHPDMFQVNRPGDYDGADGISRAVFGGTLMPDQAAQELFEAYLIKEPTPDAMWALLHQEQATVGKMKEAVKAAQEDARAAKLRAKEEANAWLAERTGDQAANFSQKEEIQRSLAMLDAILAALPYELRGRLGGHTQMARIESDEAKLRYLKEKLALADKGLKGFLKEQYGHEFEKLLKRSRPEKDEEGKRPSGKIGADMHDLFRAIEHAMGLDAAGVEARVAELESCLLREDLTPEQEAHLNLEIGMITLAGNWHQADAARREKAYTEALRLLDGGYMGRLIEVSKRREERAKGRDALKKATGKVGSDGDERQIKRYKDAGKDTDLGAVRNAVNRAKANLHAARLAFGSFEQVMVENFGEKDFFTNHLVDRERWCSNAKTDAIIAKTEALESLFARLAGGSVLDGRKLQWAMHQPTVKVRRRPMSQMEIITASLMWRQEDGQRHMQGHLDDAGKPVGEWNYDQAWVDEAESKLDDNARAVRLFLIDQYAAEYDRINAVFRDLYGVNLPRHAFYSPLSVKPSKEGVGQVVDPTTGFMMNGMTMTPGSLRNRSQTAVAEPWFQDAAQLFLGHIKQMEHFIAYGKFNADMMAMFLDRGVLNSVEEKGGKAARDALTDFVDYFAQGGHREAGQQNWASDVFRAMGRNAASSILIGKAGVILIQTTQLSAAALEMPIPSYVKRLAKLSTGQLHYRVALNTPYIQRRFKELPVMVRMAVDSLAAAEPTYVNMRVQQLGGLIGGMDALCTAGTYAMIYDYQLMLAKESDMADAEAEAFAHNEAERGCDRVGQPTRPGTRSMLENRAAVTLKFSWAFASEQRQKTAKMMFELANPDASLSRKTRVLFVGWLVMGMMAAVLRAAKRDLLDGGDDEWFDEKNWSLKNLALSTLCGPLGGLPIIGDMVQSGVYTMAGEYYPEGNIVSNFGKGTQALMHTPEWFDGTKDAGEIISDVDKILSGLAVLNGRAAEYSSLMHLAKDLFGLSKQVTDP